MIIYYIQNIQLYNLFLMSQENFLIIYINVHYYRVQEYNFLFYAHKLSSLTYIAEQ